MLWLAGLGVPVYAPEGARLPDLVPLPAAAYPIHDAQLNDRGLASVAGWFAETIPGYRHLVPGDTA
ncbi:hypothetical protein [Micromonospora sp. NPDC050276]|uniref:hypothetical protein n=1 Tax=Micromonospora sp. NPDC050276 TaxID=3364278 RepID=UPI0037B09554